MNAPLKKGGLEATGIGRSKGGLTIDLQSMRLARRSERSSHPQALGLIEGLTDAQHVIMDAAYDADHLRTFIAPLRASLRDTLPVNDRTLLPDLPALR